MMTMVLPANSIELEQEEMIYLDAGWSLQQIAKNAVGLAAVAGLQWVGRAILNFVRANPGAGYGQLVVSMGATAAKAFWALPWWAKGAGLATGAAVIYAMGTWDMF